MVHHGGDLIGFHSDMMWLPEHGVGAVVLTNGDPGWIAAHVFRRKLLEVLFDGRPEADADVAAQAKSFYDSARRRPEAAHRSGRYCRGGEARRALHNDALGDIDVRRERRREPCSTSASFGVRSRRGRTRTARSRSSPSTPASSGFEFVVERGLARTLTIRDAQHEYVFEAGTPSPQRAAGHSGSSARP